MDSGLLPPPGTLTIKNEFLFIDASISAMSAGLGLQVKDRTQAYNNAVFICYASGCRYLVSAGRSAPSR